MSEAEEDSFSLEVMINKEKTKVLFAEADGHFADILLSFLTLPLGRLVKVLEKHYGDKAPVIGSMNSLCNNLANLDTLYFWTDGAKLTLLNPKSSFKLEYQSLKLDIYDFHPAEYLQCSYSEGPKIPCVSLYYDFGNKCHQPYSCEVRKKVDEKGSRAASSDGAFTKHTESFIISDDLKILPSDMGPLKIISILGITDTDTDNGERIKVTFGLNEIMSLLKASLVSLTPLSDLILNTINSAMVVSELEPEPEPETLSHQIENEDPRSKKMILKLMIRKSTGKLMYAQAKDDFIEFLLSFINIPLGVVEHLLAGKTGFKAISNLYRSTCEFMNDEHFKTPDMKNRLIKPKLLHGCVSKNHILPLTEERLTADYGDLSRLSSLRFPKGKGSYLEGPRTYKVMDDLTIIPFSNMSILSSLNELKISISDVKEVQLQVGLKEALRILRASLTSTSALTDGLLKHISLTQPKEEPN